MNLVLATGVVRGLIAKVERVDVEQSGLGPSRGCATRQNVPLAVLKLSAAVREQELLDRAT
jgi:hypothetical protein